MVLRQLVALLAVLVPTVGAQCYADLCQVRPPRTPAEQPAWLRTLKQQREVARRTIGPGLDGGALQERRLGWTRTAYIAPQMHPYDRYFYDKATRSYTVRRYLRDLEARYGGIDALLLWPSYPLSGIDDRNQFDFFRALPGGLEAVANVTRELREHGVRVLWPYQPWDSGTHREPASDHETLARLLKDTGGAGLNADTLPWTDPQGFKARAKRFWEAGLALDYPLAIQPEGGGVDEALPYTTLGWGYWMSLPAPVVDRFKFLSHGRFLTNVCDRWAKRKTDNLQNAWFNGDGYVPWENVWGTWNGIVPRDGEAIRRVAAMLRFFGSRGYLQSPRWEPHARGAVHASEVYTSYWPLAEQDTALWTLVNRGGRNLTGPQLRVQSSGGFWYDCYHGVELSPENFSLAFDIEAWGFGCVLRVSDPAEGALKSFLQGMRAMTRRALGSYSPTWGYLAQTMVSMPATKRFTSAPPGTVFVPRGSFDFKVRGVEVEGDDGHGVDVQYPWEAAPQREHHREAMDVGPFFMDKFPVTCANYSSYLKATHYRPADPYNWLKNWGGSAEPPAALAGVPVTYVSLEEARLYCRWAHGGARLPHSWEWQYAAQGLDGRLYPWGNEDDSSRRPELKDGNSLPGAEPVTAHSPAGDSPFGVSDLVGNVWQFTDEFHDAHTRAAILRGGSNYRPAGSNWYFPQARRLDQHNKYLLMDDRFERAGTVGFRCLADAAEPEAGALAAGKAREKRTVSKFIADAISQEADTGGPRLEAVLGLAACAALIPLTALAVLRLRSRPLSWECGLE